jgi:protein TonB
MGAANRLLRRAVEVIVPAQIIAEFIEPPNPRWSHRQCPPSRPCQSSKPVTKKAEVLPPPPCPWPLSTPRQHPTPPPAWSPPNRRPRLLLHLWPRASPWRRRPRPRWSCPPATPRTCKTPSPPTPSLSKRLGEQGKVIIRVLIGVDGLAQKTEIRQSSGFDRLDQAALTTVQRWRYVPGKRNGVAEAMWFNVPVNFVLE